MIYCLLQHRQYTMSPKRQTHKVKSKNLDHHVAGMYDELGIGKVIDEAIEPDMEKRQVSIGQAMKAMVLNGLGFVNQRLYLFPKFFQDKPVSRLIGKDIKAEDLNEHVMGRALDDIYKHEVTGLYSQIAINAAQVLKLKCETGHLDSTSFHTDGAYEISPNENAVETNFEANTQKYLETILEANDGNNSEVDKTEEVSPSVIKITKGYSRDHRPDLNQAILQLIVENQAGIPILMKPMDGNSDDKTGFRETIQAHIKQLMTAHPLKYIISDSALYTEKSLPALTQNPSLRWISRVPETINEAKEAIEESELSEMIRIDEQTRYQAINSCYADIEQRWIIIHSSQAEKRAKRTLNKTCLKVSTANIKSFKILCKKTFSSQEEATKSLQEFEKKLLFTSVAESQIKAIPRYQKRGKPAKNANVTTFTK